MMFLVEIFPVTLKPSKIVFTPARKLLKQCYIIGLDNHCSSPELFDMLNECEKDAEGTACTMFGVSSEVKK
jgi:hypothetical protein